MFGLRGKTVNKAEDYYRREGQYFLVELKLNEVKQLFNSLDPSPFREKDLDEDAKNYIVDSVQEFHIDTPVRLVFHMPTALCTDDTRAMIMDAIHNYFSYRADIAGKELRFAYQQGRRAFGIGLVFLIVCLGAQQLIAALSKSGLLWLIAQEGFLIMGWVAMWRAIDIFLYETWMIRRKRRVYEKLTSIPVDLRPA